MENEKIIKLKNQYKLSKKNHNEIYQIIRKMVFENKKPSEHPISIIVGAQPGSGKGSLIGYSKKMFLDNNVIIISSDDYKPFHPKASIIAKNYPTLYSVIVEEDSAKWTSKILKEAIEKKYNFIFECTLRNERIIERMKELKENDFEVIVKVMAVSYLESLLSAYERYEKQVEVRSWGRFFDPSSYNDMYQNIPNTIQSIQSSKYYDAIEVYKRGKDIKSPQLIYSTYTKEYKLRHQDIINYKKFLYTTAKEAILKYRNEEVENLGEKINERIKKLNDDFDRRNATQEERKGLDILNEIALNYNYK